MLRKKKLLTNLEKSGLMSKTKPKPLKINDPNTNFIPTRNTSPARARLERGRNAKYCGRDSVLRKPENKNTVAARSQNFIKFLGTAGARFVMIKQLRASGGIWIKYKSTNIIIDPGPGAIVRCGNSKPKLNPSTLDAIILTHKHLDHSSDVNVMVEAITEGGFKKRGELILPQDAVGENGVLFSYLTNYIGKITTLKEGAFKVGDINFEVPTQNIHSVQTYGLKFSFGDEIVSFICDTKYFTKLADIYKNSTILILNVVFYEKRSEYDHLSLPEALELIQIIKPKKTILTHFGMSMLQKNPYNIEKEIRAKFKLNIDCAYDGMTVNLPANP